MMRIGSMLFTMLVTMAAQANAQSTSLLELRDEGVLRTGQTVYVTDVAGERVKGTVQELSGGSLTLVTGRNDRRTFEPLDLARIQRSDSVANGLLIGLAGGFAGALVARNSICDLPDSECEVIVNAVVGLPMVVGGGVIGAVADMLIRKTVFSASATPSGRVGVSPWVSRSRRGVSVALAF